MTDDLTTVIVSDLIPFVEYSYTVVAVNEVGRSDMSQPSPFVMTEAASESEEERYIPFTVHCLACCAVSLYIFVEMVSMF